MNLPKLKQQAEASETLSITPEDQIGFSAMALFGVIWTRKESLNAQTIRHESIHLAQERELWYVGYIVLYLVEYLYKLLKYWNWRKAYKSVRLEQEAYGNEDNVGYLENRKPFAWRDYK